MARLGLVPALLVSLVWATVAWCATPSGEYCAFINGRKSTLVLTPSGTKITGTIMEGGAPASSHKVHGHWAEAGQRLTFFAVPPNPASKAISPVPAQDYPLFVGFFFEMPDPTFPERIAGYFETVANAATTHRTVFGWYAYKKTGGSSGCLMAAAPSPLTTAPTGNFCMRANGHSDVLTLTLDANNNYSGSWSGSELRGYWEPNSRTMTLVRLSSNTDNMQVYVGYAFLASGVFAGDTTPTVHIAGQFDAVGGTAHATRNAYGWYAYQQTSDHCPSF